MQRLICTAHLYRCAVHTHTHTHTHILTAPTQGSAEYSHRHVHTTRPLSSRTLTLVWREIWLRGVCSKPTKCQAKVGSTVFLWEGS